jgi:hypothetical protein
VDGERSLRAFQGPMRLHILFLGRCQADKTNLSIQKRIIRMVVAAKDALLFGEAALEDAG